MNLPGGPTRDEILAIALSKIDVRPGDLFLDVGCGTGKVSVRAAPLARHVVACDLRKEAVAFARKEAEEAGARNIEFFCDNATEIIPRIERPDCAFIGGSHDLAPVLSLLAERNVRSVVVTAVKMDTMVNAITLLKGLGMFREAVLVALSRADPLGNNFIWRPEIPVAIVVGGWEEC
ncbi:MAG: methyltransferase domain-containing protein [Methanolinea sp.]|nr:methyltransferase domain-containing protein [Methanolinea sp.]